MLVGGVVAEMVPGAHADSSDLTEVGHLASSGLSYGEGPGRQASRGVTPLGCPPERDRRLVRVLRSGLSSQDRHVPGRPLPAHCPTARQEERGSRHECGLISGIWASFM